MFHPAPSFPAFDEWQKLSKSEQDALLDQWEAASRDGSLVKRVLIAVLCVAACAVIGAGLVAARL